MSAPVEEPTLDLDGLSVDEVGALWAFLHGDIMESGIRARLREHLGLCPRHAWGHALVEIELWESGAGARGGHQPFDVGVLYDDLLTRMASALSRRHHRYARTLRREGTCYICQQLVGDIQAVGYAGFDSVPLTEEANRMIYVKRWLTETQPIWGPSACPRCTGSPDGNLCRPHLLDADIDVRRAAEVGDYLFDIDRRLQVLVSSMTEDGAPSTPDADASWVEAIAWFTGWSTPRALT